MFVFLLCRRRRYYEDHRRRRDFLFPHLSHRRAARPVALVVVELGHLYTHLHNEELIVPVVAVVAVIIREQILVLEDLE